MTGVSRIAFAPSLVVALLIAAPVSARVKSIQITRNEAVFGGTSFGGVGPYQKISGVVHGEVDPAEPLNAIMVANDCLGFAAVKGITAFPAETNEIGDLELRPISEFPEVDGLGCTGQPNARAE